MVNTISTDMLSKESINGYLNMLVRSFCFKFGLTYKIRGKLKCVSYNSVKSKLKLTDIDIKNGIFVNSSYEYAYYSKDYIINGLSSEVLTLCLTNIDKEFAISGSFVGLMNVEHLRVNSEIELFNKIRDLHKHRPRRQHSL